MSCSGHVKFFSLQKGFGFILTEDGREVFVHQSAIQGNPLMQNDFVHFEIQEQNGGQKLVARNVTGGTASPFKGKYQGGMMDNNKGGYNNKGGFNNNKGGKGKGGKGGFRKGGKYGDEEEEEEDQWGGKCNSGKGILPGGRHNTWYKGGQKGDEHMVPDGHGHGTIMNHRNDVS